MNLIIDANIFAGYFKEEIIGAQLTDLTFSPSFIFNRLGKEDTCFFDTNGFIKHEWCSLVEPEWFTHWYIDGLRDGKIFEIVPANYNHLNKALKLLGFPSSLDIWYIKTCKKAIEIHKSAFIVTEDLDFYEPKLKSCNSKKRIEILINSRGNVSRYLQKNEGISIYCVQKYYELVNY